LSASWNQAHRCFPPSHPFRCRPSARLWEPVCPRTPSPASRPLPGDCCLPTTFLPPPLRASRPERSRKSKARNKKIKEPKSQTLTLSTFAVRPTRCPPLTHPLLPSLGKTQKTLAVPELDNKTQRSRKVVARARARKKPRRKKKNHALPSSSPPSMPAEALDRRARARVRQGRNQKIGKPRSAREREMDTRDRRRRVTNSVPADATSETLVHESVMPEVVVVVVVVVIVVMVVIVGGGGMCSWTMPARRCDSTLCPLAFFRCSVRCA
jgi:hypothetical protein